MYQRLYELILLDSMYKTKRYAYNYSETDTKKTLHTSSF